MFGFFTFINRHAFESDAMTAAEQEAQRRFAINLDSLVSGALLTYAYFHRLFPTPLSETAFIVGALGFYVDMLVYINYDRIEEAMHQAMHQAGRHAF